MKYTLGSLLVALFFMSCNAQKNNIQSKSQASTSNIEKLIKSEAAWKAELSDSEFNVLREKGTERAFTGDLLNEKREGVFTCRACALPLFSSDTKFKSGTGWPSYYDVIDKANVGELEDKKFGMVRTEVVCNRCDGHLGHVFNDGPKPTGLRYCINAISMDFVPTEKEADQK